MYDKLCPMSFNSSTFSRDKMNCLGVACAWFNSATSGCAVVSDIAPAGKKKPTAKSTPVETK